MKIYRTNMKILTEQTELTTKDIAELKGISLSSAGNVRATIRTRLNKRPYSVITYAEYKQVFDIKL